jgi:hypothetical protein
VDIVILFGRGAREWLARIEQKLDMILDKENVMADELDILTQEVEETEGAIDSVIALVQGLSDYIKAHSDNPAAMLELAAKLDAGQQKIAAAVAANPLPE